MSAQVTARQPLLARLLRWYLRTQLRGRTRLTAIVTRHLRTLWSVPIRIQDCPPLFVDLRSGHAQYLLQGEPWTHAPREQPEQEAMRRVATIALNPRRSCAPRGPLWQGVRQIWGSP